MSRLTKDELPFRLVGITVDQLYAALENIDDDETVEPLPSGSESEIDDSDIENPTVNTGDNTEDIIISESEDSESDLPIATVRNSIINRNATTSTTFQVYNPPIWSNNTKPIAPQIFQNSFGVPEFIKDMEDVTPYKIFQELVRDEFIEHLVFQSNLYAEQTKIVSGKNYIPTNKTEVNTFLGINLLMGIKHSPSYKDYWSSAPELNDPFISHLMNQKRFGWLLSHLHVNDNSAMPAHFGHLK